MMDDKIAERKIERHVAENVSEAIWLRLRRLTSTQLCRKLLTSNRHDLNQEEIDSKATGMSWAVKGALGYWDTREGGLNAKVLSRYYALLQISIAEQISSGSPKEDLATVQRHTEHGHGLFTITGDGTSTFPDNYFIGCLNSGHFAAYCQSRGLAFGAYANDRRPRKWCDADKAKVVSLTDLLRRVPELQGVAKEYINHDPLSFHFGHAQRNMIEKSERRTAYIASHGRFPDEAATAEMVTTYAAIYPQGSEITAEELNGYGFPIKNIREEETIGLSKEKYFVGEVQHPGTELWWNYVPSYKSGYSGTSLIVPFWGMIDPMVLHFSILYAFSIIVRYLPETWHEIEYGRLDHIRALIEHYLVIVDNVLPGIAVEQLTKTKLMVAQPGGLSAPI
jgi:hypothetical protein